MFMTELMRPSGDHITVPLCPNCGRAMHLDRVTPRMDGLAELHTFKCGECGVWATEAADTADEEI